MNHAASQSTMSEVNPLQDLSTFTSPRGDGFSLDDVFAAMMQDIHDLFEQVSACEVKFQQISKQRKPKRSRSSSLMENNEYMALLTKKGNLLQGITAAIEKIESSPEIPKTKIHCYQKFASLLKQRFENISQDVESIMEDLRNSKEECKRVEKQIETFRKLKEDEDAGNEGDEVMRLFKEGKTDMNTLLSILYPENIKRELTSAMAQLTDAFMKNDSEEDQYVELSPETLQNPGIISLMNGYVIVKDPSNPLKYRLNMAE